VIVRLLRFGVRHGLRQGWRRGVLGNIRAFLVVGGVALVGHLAGRVLGGEPDVVFSEKLLPGETFRITHEPKA
jgi:hypothetical protein